MEGLISKGAYNQNKKLFQNELQLHILIWIQWNLSLMNLYLTKSSV